MSTLDIARSQFGITTLVLRRMLDRTDDCGLLVSTHASDDSQGVTP